MWDVKMDHALWQWTADSKDSKPVHMWTYYPTTLAGFHQKNSYDAVAFVVAIAVVEFLEVIKIRVTDGEIITARQAASDFGFDCRCPRETRRRVNDQVALLLPATLSVHVRFNVWAERGSNLGGTV